MMDLGSDEIRLANDSIRSWISNNLQTDLATYSITGTAIIIDKNNEYLRESMFKGLGLAFLVVSVLMVFLFKNVKMMLISLIPNIIPLLVAGAIMGFTGIELKASTSIIFTIAFGIAVDDTIHFLSKLKLVLNRGKSLEEAIQRTFKETGKAIVITSVILFFGFLILIFSDFTGTFYIGILVSVTLLSAVITDLYLLPVSLRLLLRKKKKD